MMSSAAGLWKLFRDQAERGSGIGLKLFGFIAECVIRPRLKKETIQALVARKLDEAAD